MLPLITISGPWGWLGALSLLTIVKRYPLPSKTLDRVYGMVVTNCACMGCLPSRANWKSSFASASAGLAFAGTVVSSNAGNNGLYRGKKCWFAHPTNNNGAIRPAMIFKCLLMVGCAIQPITIQVIWTFKTSACTGVGAIIGSSHALSGFTSCTIGQGGLTVTKNVTAGFCVCRLHLALQIPIFIP